MNKENIDITRRLESVLLKVEKPGRYVGGEFNIIKKNNPYIKTAICYPDLYEIGMANNGISILYNIINAIDYSSCERVFAVAKDFYDILKDENIPLYTLETKTPIKAMDMVAFNLSHEMLITNVLQVLDLGGVALLSSERNEDDPIIIAGGESTSNPSPFIDFFDAFFIGEGEEGIAEIVESLKKSKDDGLPRKEKLGKLSLIEGLFIPSLYEIKNNDEEFDIFSGKAVKRRISKKSYNYNVRRPVVPNIRITQARAIIELTRGCYNLCKFCHAGYYTHPYRSYNPEIIKNDIFEILENTGYNEVSFSSLSISDYRHLVKLINMVLPTFNEKGISISLPSLKVDKGTLPIINCLSGVRKTTLTFAVESASEEIRRIIHKRVSNDDLINIFEHVLNLGWKTIKLYFMIGLPGYKEYDEGSAIVELLKRVNQIGPRNKKINVTISPFVPKPHTPFDNSEMADIDYFENTIRYVKSNCPRQISIKNHDPATSQLEGLLARGDNKFNNVILKIYKNGSFLDSWKEYFNYNNWISTVKESIPDYIKYFKKRTVNNNPWNIISVGINKIIDKKREKVLDIEELKNLRCNFNETLNEDLIENSLENLEKKYEVNARYRFVVTKNKELIYASHLDFLEICRRAFRILEIPISFTQGFNKHERITAGFPVPIGIESNCELIDVDLYNELDIKKINLRKKYGPEGFEIIDIIKLIEKQSIMENTDIVEYEVLFFDKCLLENLIENIKLDIFVQKKTKKGQIDLKLEDSIFKYNIIDNKLIITLFQGSTNSIRIDIIIKNLCKIDFIDLSKISIRKINQYKLENQNLVSLGSMCIK